MNSTRAWAVISAVAQYVLAAGCLCVALYFAVEGLDASRWPAVLIFLIFGGALIPGMSKWVSKASKWAPLAFCLAVGCVAAYFVWPTGITDMPLGAITFGALLRAIGAGLIMLVALYIGVICTD